MNTTPAESARPGTRVLHLIDPATGGWTALEALAARLRADPHGDRNSCVLIGSAADVAEARRLGVAVHDRIHAPLRSARFGATALRRLLQRRPAPDVVHAWSLETLSLAAVAAPLATRRVTLCAQPQCASPAFAMAAMLPSLLRPRRNGGPVVVEFLSEHLRRLWSAAGLGDAATRGRIASAPPEVNLVPLPDRDALRMSWGVDDADFVVALLGEPASALDGRRLFTVAGPLAVSGRRVVCAAPIGARGAERSRRFFERLGHRCPLIPCSPTPWRTLPGVDAAIWFGADVAPGAGSRISPGARSIEWACALGTPVVAEDQPEAREAAPEGATALFTTPDRPLEMAQALLSITSPAPSALDARS